jgi:hypothetical protein
MEKKLLLDHTCELGVLFYNGRVRFTFAHTLFANEHAKDQLWRLKPTSVIDDGIPY